MFTTAPSSEALDLLSAAIMAANESGYGVLVEIDRLAFKGGLEQDVAFEAERLAWRNDAVDVNGDDNDAWEEMHGNKHKSDCEVCGGAIRSFSSDCVCPVAECDCDGCAREYRRLRDAGCFTNDPPDLSWLDAL